MVRAAQRARRQSLQNPRGAAPGRPRKEKLEALDELCVSVSRRWRGGGRTESLTDVDRWCSVYAREGWTGSAMASERQNPRPSGHRGRGQQLVDGVGRRAWDTESGTREKTQTSQKRRDFELSDLDNAKDFHDALGGWPALAGLLSADSSEVRRRAAQAVGTAAKHGFQAWVLEAEVLPRLVAMLEETSWPARKAAVYALGCALRSSAPVQRAFGRRGMAALSKLAAAALDDAGNQQAWAVADKVAALLGDLVQEGRAVPPDACDAVAAVLAKAPADGRADRPLRAVLAAVPHCGAGWRSRNAVDVSGLRDAFPGDEYGRDLVQLCDDVTEAIRTAEEPRRRRRSRSRTSSCCRRS